MSEFHTVDLTIIDSWQGRQIGDSPYLVMHFEEKPIEFYASWEIHLPGGLHMFPAPIMDVSIIAWDNGTVGQFQHLISPFDSGWKLYKGRPRWSKGEDIVVWYQPQLTNLHPHQCSSGCRFDQSDLLREV